MSAEERDVLLQLLAEGERCGTWNVYLHGPRFRHLESAMARAIRGAYALLGVPPGRAMEEQQLPQGGGT